MTNSTTPTEETSVFILNPNISQARIKRQIDAHYISIKTLINTLPEDPLMTLDHQLLIHYVYLLDYLLEELLELLLESQ